MGTRVITMTGRPPVQIDETEWPIIAKASGHDGEVEAQANRKGLVRVRQHADGRTIVYGVATSQFRDERDRRAGYLLASGHGQDHDYLAANIRDVAEAIGWPDLAQECIADLPPEVL